jgi:hypothetical protein
MKSAAIGSLIASTLLLSVLGTPGTAFAQKPRVVVERFSGPGTAKLRLMVWKILYKQKADVVPDKKVSTAEASLGLLQVSDNYATAAKELGASVFISGTVQPYKKGFVVVVKAKGANGAQISTPGAWLGKTVPKALAKSASTLPKKLAAIVAASPPGGSGGGGEEVASAEKPGKDDKGGEAGEKGSASADDEPRGTGKKKKMAVDEDEPPAKRSKASSEDEAVTASDEAEAKTPGTAPKLDMALGAHVYRRDFRYNENRQGNQQEYRLPAVPAPSLSVDYFFTPNIGASVGGEYSVALISQDAAGARYKTSSLGFFLGAKYRYLLSSSTELLGGVAFASNSFKITAENGDVTAPKVAGVDYKQIKAGVAMRMALTDQISVLAGADYLHLLGIGELKDSYFPSATGRGGQASAGFTMALPWKSGLEARATLDFRRYVFSMNSVATDTRLAGGAVDQYLGINIGLGYRQ